jgi:hypothetical protein
MILAFETNPPNPPLRKGGRGDFAGVTAKLNSSGINRDVWGRGQKKRERTG